MTLRLSAPADRPVLTALWQEAFGDTKETVDLFFNTCYQAENALVAEEDGQIAAVLYLLENTLQTKEGRFSAAYIYAAATAKKYRKRGLMTELLRYALETAQARDWDHLYLVPANADLYRYYGARGFETAFFKEEIQISRAELAKMAAKSPTALPDTPKTRLDVREHALKAFPHIVWSENVLAFAKKLDAAFDVHGTLFANGFAVWEQDGAEAFVSEFCCTPDARPETAALLLEHCTAEHFTLCTPVGLFPVAGKALSSGMLQAVSDRAKTHAPEILYLGMTLG